MKTVLVTGGTGFIGSHTVVELLQNEYKVIIIDNLINSNIKVLDRIEEIVGEKFKNLDFYKIDLINFNEIIENLKNLKVSFCIHFAGLKAVGESVKNPILYYNTNILSTLNLIKFLEMSNCKKLIFSSSATVYGDSKSPLEEGSKTGNNLTNPYGKTKYMIEQILTDYVKSRNDFSVVNLRYFNPIGSHSSGLIGEDPSDIPNNLMPYVLQVAVEKRDFLTIFGDSYDTHDGTGVRDYVHVCDLAKGHLLAMEKIENLESVLLTYNLGTGIGYSVKDIVNMMIKVSNKKIKFKIGDKRAGDVDKVYCNPIKAMNELNWKAENNLEDMCRDSWNWIVNNPNGYE